MYTRMNRMLLELQHTVTRQYLNDHEKVNFQHMWARLNRAERVTEAMTLNHTLGLATDEKSRRQLRSWVMTQQAEITEEIEEVLATTRP